MSTAVQKDARNRALRTLVQGLMIDLLIAVAVTSHSILTSNEFSWTVLGLAIAKTALTTLASYVMRIKMGSVMLNPGETPEPVTLKIGDHEMTLQRPGHADHRG